ncbi:MAG: proline dehydrogenase [SAR324 cluster bacterium]|uniref:Proline dehydrogenase n=1 Tax=SAR324 cluster bacterium TaxID=2024889 RepID=A0A7X9FPL0_9DELT|nr:proline dehydrogenase [SAR324 cluster bacterium]
MQECKNFDPEATEFVFSKLTNTDLRRAYFLFWCMAHPSLNRLGQFLINSSFKFNIPIEWFVEATIFRQFCGGTTLEKTVSVIDSLWSSSIGSILDLSIEGNDTESSRDRTANEIASGIVFSVSIKPKVPMFAVKLTGLFDFNILEKKHARIPLNDIETKQYKLGLQRIETISKAAHDNDIAISIDAEQSWIQDPIDEICLDLMRRYNKTKPIIGTTFQFYRHDRIGYFQNLLETAKKESFVLAFKAVRGAYMESERERAKQLGYLSPIHPNKQSTDEAFNSALEITIKNISHLSFWIATHNQESCLYAIKLMSEKGLKASDPRISFAQLRGMSDNISYNLAHAGYRVAKYLPFGPVKHVLPYLFRRADENTAVSREQPARELEFIRREMKRRKLL